MRTAVAIALALALSLTCTQLAVADEKAATQSSANLQSSVSQGDELHFETVLTVHGEIASVDQANRRLTLEGQGGGILALEARDQKNLEGIKAGDQVVIQYVEGVHIAKKKPKDAQPIASLKDGIIAAEPGELANAGNPRRHMAVGSVEAIDKPFQEITLKGPDGSQETVMVENPETLEHLKVGDQIVITDALALALSLEKES
jgi:preprotein translocase subunit YajC